MIGTTTLIARHRTNELVQNLTRTISPTFIQPGIGPYLSTNHRYLWSKEGEENLASVLTGGNHPLSSTRQQLFLAERKGKEGKALSLPGEITRLDVSPPSSSSSTSLFQRQSGIISGLKRIDLYTSLYPSIDRHYFKIRTFIEFTSGFETGTKIYRVTVGGGNIEVERGIYTRVWTLSSL